MIIWSHFYRFAIYRENLDVWIRKLRSPALERQQVMVAKSIGSGAEGVDRHLRLAPSPRTIKANNTNVFKLLQLIW